MFPNGLGASSSVDSTPIAWPCASRNPLPESPGMPGVTVYTRVDQPLVLPRLMPYFGDNCVMPLRNDELP